MKKLIKADLSAILRLAGESRFLAADSLDPCIAKLCRQEYTDFLFLARTPWCCIFGFPTVYVCGSYANLCTLACCSAPGGAVTALFLHIEKTVRGQPWGSVTLLEYPIVAQDVGGAVRAVSRPAEAARSADGQAVHPERPVLQHSGRPYISESKRGGLNVWTQAAK